MSSRHIIKQIWHFDFALCASASCNIIFQCAIKIYIALTQVPYLYNISSLLVGLFIRKTSNSRTCRAGFETGQRWETASNQWQSLWPLSPKDRPLFVCKSLLLTHHTVDRGTLHGDRQVVGVLLRTVTTI